MSWLPPLPPGKKWIGEAPRRDFEAWAYSLDWPNKYTSPAAFPVTTSSPSPIRVAVEDFKFAYNAWCTVRACMFYGLPHPRLLSAGRTTTPTLDIAAGGNRVFHMHCDVNQKGVFMQEARHCEQKGDCSTDVSGKPVKIALTPSDPRAVDIYSLDWQSLMRLQRPIELVLGMENGLSADVADACDHCVYLPQYGSIGSLSMTSALAHAVHVVHSEHHRSARLAQEPLLRSAVDLLQSRVQSTPFGHKPASNEVAEVEGDRAGSPAMMPHEKTMIGWSNDAIRLELERQRSEFPLQLSLVFENQFSDRNIGASVRNANVYNCEQVLISGRRKFNHRGTVGTHLYTPVRHVETLFLGGGEAGLPAELDGYECWMVHTAYPFIQNHYIHRAEPLPSIVGKKRTRLEHETFIRHDDARISQWLAQQDPLSPTHPQAPFLKHVSLPSVYLDNEASVQNAVRDTYRRSCRGVALLVHEDGSTACPAMARLAHRVCHVVHPGRLCKAQRDLPPALLTAVALGVVRRAIDGLYHHPRQ